MKRFWIGILVLAVLLAAGSAVAFCMSRCHDPISEGLAQAVQAVQAGQWARGVALAENAHGQWLRCRDFTAAVADHTVIEQVNALFAEIDTYAAAGDSIGFCAACAHLSELSKAVAESHLPKWQNIL